MKITEVDTEAEVAVALAECDLVLLEVDSKPEGDYVPETKVYAKDRDLIFRIGEAQGWQWVWAGFNNFLSVAMDAQLVGIIIHQMIEELEWVPQPEPVFEGDWSTLIPKMEREARRNGVMTVRIPLEERERLENGGLDELRRAVSDDLAGRLMFEDEDHLLVAHYGSCQ